MGGGDGVGVVMSRGLIERCHGIFLHLHLLTHGMAYLVLPDHDHSRHEAVLAAVGCVDGDGDAVECRTLITLHVVSDADAGECRLRFTCHAIDLG